MSWRIGEIAVSRVEQSLEPIAELAYLLPGLEPEAVDRHLHWLAPEFVEPDSRRYVLSVHSWLLRTPQVTVLIDACSGNRKQRPTSVRHHDLDIPFLERLAAAGCRPEDVDYVFCTHLHVDHVGFNTTLVGDRWVPTFPNARYLFSPEDYACWDPASPLATRRGDNDLIFADSIAPVVEAGQAQFVDDGWELDGRLRVERAAGHTPGHFVVRARSGADRAIFSGDAMHHPIQVAEPAVNSRYCADPDAARAARRRVLETCAEGGDVLFPAHFGRPHAGTISAAGDAFRFVPRFPGTERTEALHV